MGQRFVAARAQKPSCRSRCVSCDWSSIASSLITICLCSIDLQEATCHSMHLCYVAVSAAMEHRQEVTRLDDMHVYIYI
jgi:hypothetical protein